MLFTLLAGVDVENLIFANITCNISQLPLLKYFSSISEVSTCQICKDAKEREMMMNWTQKRLNYTKGKRFYIITNNIKTNALRKKITKKKILDNHPSTQKPVVHL